MHLVALCVLLGGWCASGFFPFDFALILWPNVTSKSCSLLAFWSAQSKDVCQTNNCHNGTLMFVVRVPPSLVEAVIGLYVTVHGFMPCLSAGVEFQSLSGEAGISFGLNPEFKAFIISVSNGHFTKKWRTCLRPFFEDFYVCPAASMDGCSF